MTTALRVGPRTDRLDAALALEAARTAAWRWAIGSPAIEWSPGAARVLGLPEIVLQSPELLLAAIDPEDLALAKNALEGWQNGHLVCAQIRARLAGQVRWFDVSGRVVAGDHAVPAYATGTLRDVTEDREAQDALLEALHEAQALLSELGALTRAGSAPVRRTRVA